MSEDNVVTINCGVPVFDVAEQAECCDEVMDCAQAQFSILYDPASSNILRNFPVIRLSVLVQYAIHPAPLILGTHFLW